jgi:hypothetical protein
MLEPRRINCGLKKAPPGPFLPLRIRLLEALPLRLSASFLPQVGFRFHLKPMIAALGKRLAGDGGYTPLT